MAKKTTRQRLAELGGADYRPASYAEQFEDDAAFWSAVADAGSERVETADARLLFAAATGLGEKFPSEGGWLIPDATAESLWTAVYNTGAILQRCTRQPVSRDKLRLPAIDERSRADGSRMGGVRSYWADEAATVTATKPKFRSMTLQPNKLLSLCHATDELLADAPALAAFLNRAYGAEASHVIEQEIISGSGAGRPLGILNAGATIEVAIESGQAAGTIQAENLRKMNARLWGPSHRAAIWLMNNDGFAQISDDSFSNGQPVVIYGGDGTPRILGKPVLLVEQTSQVGALGDVILADMSQYIVAEKEPNITSSIHVRFLNDESIFRFRYRVDGQPAWLTAVMPKNSSTTQSPFITLATRE